MKKTVYFMSALFVILFVSCGPSQKVTSSWKNPQVTTTPQYKKIFIMALVPNQNYRSIIEQDLAAAAQSHRFQTISSMDIIPSTFTAHNGITKEEILQRVRAAGADAILTTALVDKTSETRYVPGTTTYTPYMGYGGFGGYYGYAYGSMYSTPGYYTEDKTYFMEARLFDVASENMIWSAQSEAYNPSKIEKFSKEYTDLLVERMQRDFGTTKK